MKKLKIIVLALLLTVIGGVCALAETAVVATGGGFLNLRTKPSKSATSIYHIPNGATVELIEAEADGFYRVSYKGKKGYAMAQFLRVGETSPDQPLYTDTNDAQFLRAAPDDNAALLMTITYATPMTVLSYEGQWAKVSCKDGEGRELVGYIPESAISLGRTTPGIDTYGEVVNAVATVKSAQSLYELPDGASSVCAALTKGTQAVVRRFLGAWAYVTVDAYVGYVPTNSLLLTGETASNDAYAFADYTAHYYSAVARDGTLELFTEPTLRDVTSPRETLAVGKDAKLTVLVKSQRAGGKDWSLVSDGKTTGWVLNSTLDFSDALETYEYPVSVSSDSSGVAYAAKGGAHLYADGSSLSKLLAVVPEGDEVAVTLRSGYVSATYNGTHGYIPASELHFGFVGVPGWAYGADAPQSPADEAPAEEKSIAREEARRLADAALAGAYADFSADGLRVVSEKYLRKGGIEGPFYEFGYYDGGRYLYMCMIHAQTGAALRTADYTDFVPAVTPTPKPTAAPAKKKSDEISASTARAKADSALANKFSYFGDNPYVVQSNRYASKPNYDGPLYQFDYYLNDIYVFCCIVHAKTGDILLASNEHNPELTEIDYSTPSPAPTYESSVDIGQSRARGIADGALAGKYPTFAGNTFSSVSVRYTDTAADFEKPYYQFDYYVNGEYAYSCIVHAWTGNVLYTFAGIAGEGNG